MSAWGDLSDSQRAFYAAFHAPRQNNVRILPSNNENVSLWLCSPTEALINQVIDTGDELVRTINFRLTMEQRYALYGWVEEHGDNEQRQRLIPMNPLII